MAELERMKPRGVTVVALLAGWAAVLLCGFVWAQRYAAAPGEPAQALSRWPEGTAIARVGGQPELLLFAHPECPCTRATLRVLERLLARTQSVHADVVFVTADGSSPVGSALWSLAVPMRGVTVLADRGGVEARRFGVATSGQALLFDASGNSIFRGGLTSARGHEGAAAGQDSIEELLAGRPASATTPVFGCALL